MQRLLLSFTLLSIISAAFSAAPEPGSLIQLPSDAVSLLSFKSKADLNNKLLFTLNERFDYCEWQGVKCLQNRVTRFVLDSYSLRGQFPPNSLSKLDQLRVLSLRNNSLSGPIPDLSGLVNLKSLFLNGNSFSGSFPLSILSLHRIRAVDFSLNNLTGPIPAELTSLDRLSYFRLDRNFLNGSIPAFNRSSLVVFNVSSNNFSGSVPVTPILSKFDLSCFSYNPNLCGEIINKECKRTPFFENTPKNASSPTPVSQNEDSENGVVVLSPPSMNSHKKTGIIVGFSIGFFALLASMLLFFAAIRRRRRNCHPRAVKLTTENENVTEDAMPAVDAVKEEEKVGVRSGELEVKNRGQRGNLIFCGGEASVYTLDQLMRASAELLGRGSIGTTYKAVLDNKLIVSVKRLDSCKTKISSGEVFERHMQCVGGLRHPNLVPVRAYFQAREERLIIYDYQPNGSLHNLIHGSKSTRAKPLHWTSCLKIAEDVAQGLAYIHQASKLIHGNLKSSNVLLGSDFEACVTDYCLSVLADSSLTNDPEPAGYKAPETRKSHRHATPKSDVYSFGILLLELLTGKPPSQHPYLVPTALPDWVRSVRDDDGGEDNRLGMLIEVASVCSLISPEQRPTMWQVLRMIQQIKESVVLEDHVVDAGSRYS
ncbi:Protein kinase domain [Dillenia turbinata]|uniref:Protein kinase domain n=1 Tax=Dillenia turbinata TaxID=194707 RepID=A0AAN8UWA7_9MAGN